MGVIVLLSLLRRIAHAGGVIYGGFVRDIMPPPDAKDKTRAVLHKMEAWLETNNDIDVAFPISREGHVQNYMEFLCDCHRDFVIETTAVKDGWNLYHIIHSTDSEMEHYHVVLTSRNGCIWKEHERNIQIKLDVHIRSTETVTPPYGGVDYAVNGLTLQFSNGISRDGGSVDADPPISICKNKMNVSIGFWTCSFHLEFGLCAFLAEKAEGVEGAEKAERAKRNGDVVNIRQIAADIDAKIARVFDCSDPPMRHRVAKMREKGYRVEPCSHTTCKLAAKRAASRRRSGPSGPSGPSQSSTLLSTTIEDMEADVYDANFPPLV